MAAIGGVTTIFITGFVALALALLFGTRPHGDQPPEVSTNVVAPEDAPPPTAGPPGAPPPSAPAPEPAAPPRAPPPPAAPSPHSDDHEHWDDWLHRHLGPGPGAVPANP